jgi:hypothetical protein
VSTDNRLARAQAALARARAWLLIGASRYHVAVMGTGGPEQDPASTSLQLEGYAREYAAAHAAVRDALAAQERARFVITRQRRKARYRR